MITNSMDNDFDPKQWTLEGLNEMCGSRSLYRTHPKCQTGSDRGTNGNCHSVRQVNMDLVGRQWAGMQIVDLQDLGISTVGDYLKAQVRASASL